MNRRGFIGSILALGAAPAIVRAESLVRVSGIIVPTLEEVVATGNTLVSADIIAREALEILKNNLRFSAEINRDWDDAGTITVRRPQRVWMAVYPEIAA